MCISAEWDVYVAAPLFSAGEQAFNAAIAVLLRARALNTFLPQEFAANHLESPTEAQIFHGDTTALLGSKVMLAVIDGETTDAGVAAEIGIALSHGIPIVGLWTDARQTRIGFGRMYRNIYVTGAIKHNGRLVSQPVEAADLCQCFVNSHSRKYPDEATSVIQTFHDRTTYLNELQNHLQNAYAPPFYQGSFIVELMRRYSTSPPRRIVDFGCGSALLGTAVSAWLPSCEYIGLDPNSPADPSVGATKRYGPADCNGAAFVVSAFVMHDYVDKGGLLNEMKSMLEPSGKIIILDLESSDLPNLCDRFEADLLRFGAHRGGQRLTTGKLLILAESAGLRVIESGISTYDFCFASLEVLMCYAKAFSLDCGYDVGLLQHHSGGLESAIASSAGKLTFPFHDYRSFLHAVLE